MEKKKKRKKRKKKSSAKRRKKSRKKKRGNKKEQKYAPPRTLTFASSSGGGFDHDGISDFIGQFGCGVGVRHFAVKAGNAVDFGFVGDSFGLDFVSHGGNGVRIGTHESHTHVLQMLSENCRVEVRMGDVRHK